MKNISKVLLSLCIKYIFHPHTYFAFRMPILSAFHHSCITDHVVNQNPNRSHRLRNLLLLSRATLVRKSSQETPFCREKSKEERRGEIGRLLSKNPTTKTDRVRFPGIPDRFVFPRKTDLTPRKWRTAV